jgi:protein gp37
MAETKIEWTRSPDGEQGYTFNGWEGCQKMGPGCDKCYAEARNKRFMGGQHWGPGAERRRTSPENWAKPRRWNKLAKQKGERLRVFTASLSDWLDNAVPIDWLADLLEQVKENDALDWLMLTKRIGIWRNRLSECSEVASTEAGRAKWPGLAEWINDWLAGDAPANVFVGATVVNQEEADRDVPKLLAVPARLRFLSLEPLLGPVDLTAVWRHWNMAACEPGELPDVMIHWVIVGGESDRGARPMHPDWVRSVRDQCAAAGVLFMFKQWGEWVSLAASGLEANDGYDRADLGGWVDLDGNYTVGENAAPRNSDSVHMFRMGKHHTGRMLDGMLHDAVPA